MAAAARVTIRETADGLGVYRPAERNRSMIVGLSIWLVAWGMGEALALLVLATGDDPVGNAIIYGFLALWTLGGLAGIWTLAWQLFGSERLFVAGGALVVSNGLAFLRWRSMHKLASVGNVRVETVSGGGAGTLARKRGGPTRRAVAYDVEGRRRIFGEGLDEQRLSDVAAAILRHIAGKVPASAQGT